jgi:hypothetical protein
LPLRTPRQSPFSLRRAPQNVSTSVMITNNDLNSSQHGIRRKDLKRQFKIQLMDLVWKCTDSYVESEKKPSDGHLREWGWILVRYEQRSKYTCVNEWCECLEVAIGALFMQTVNFKLAWCGLSAVMWCGDLGAFDDEKTQCLEWEARKRLRNDSLR